MLNLVLFLVLNVAMLIFMYRYSARMKNPINSRQYLLLEGTEMFFIILMATGTLALSSSGGGHGSGSGFNLQAIRLMILEVFCLLVLVVSSHKPVWGIGTVFYVIYILWLLYSMSYSQAGQYGWRYILKYLYPLLIMLAASACVRDEEVFLGVCLWSRRIALLSIIVLMTPLGLLFPGAFWYITALNLHYSTIVCVSLAMFFFYGRDWKDLVVSIVFFIPCVLAVHRTGLLAIFAAAATFAFLKFKWVSLPYIFGVLAVGVAIVFYVPAFHDKMFWKDSENELTVQDLREGNISEDDIRNNGRKAIWTMLRSEFYNGHELKGSGIGSCQKYLYENPAMVKQTHGDYVQMQCDTGLIGFVLYILVAVLILIQCTVICFSNTYPTSIKACAMIAASGLVGCYAGMYSDNAVTYTMATTSYPFAFYGMFLGMRSKMTEGVLTKERGL